MNLLVAEDEAVARTLLRVILERAGHQPTLVADGSEAWTSWIAHRFRVVISDWSMPRMDGLEVCRRIRAVTGAPYTYFIMVTGRGGRENYLEAMSAGVDDFISKPVDADELLARLHVAQRVLGLHQTLTALEKLLPICSYCKRIRRETDRWQSLEQYVGEQAHAEFSHGVCPECYAKHVQPQIDALGPLARRPGAEPPGRSKV